jgi:CRP-like cAMP-binding protein
MEHMEKKTIQCLPDCGFRRDGTTCVARIRMFQNLPEKSQEELLKHVIHTKHARGTAIVEEGDPIDSILIVRKGRIKTSRIDAEGEEHVLDVLHDGQAIWHGMFSEDPVYRYSVICLTDVDLCEIRRDEFEEVLAKRPEVAMSLISMLSTELNDAEEKAMLLGIRDPKKRLAGYLLFRDERCTGAEIHMKLDDIAASIGLRPETVSRNIKALEKDGFLKRTGQGRLLVTNRNALKKYSEEI